MKRALLISCVIVAIAWQSAAAGGDTVQVQFGIDKAYLQNDGSLSIPMYVTNPMKIIGIAWPLLITTSGQPLQPDSLTPAERYLRTIPINFLSLFTQAMQATSQVDTVCMLWATRSMYPLSAGSGVASEAWFTGAALGDQIQISLFGDGDSIPGGCWVSEHVNTTDQYGNISAVPGSFVPTTLTVVPAAVELACADTVAAQTEIPITIPVTLSGYGSAFGLQIVSLTGPSSNFAAPVITGSNPYQITWTAPMKFGGDYSLVLRGSDTGGRITDKTILIRVANSTLQGDTNCDAVVDVTDLARIVAYLTGAGKAPVCPGK